MTTRTFADAEDLAKAWLLTTPVAASIANKVFMAMPRGSPLPSVVLSRVGGRPRAGSDVPEDVARISFSCWAANRPAAKDIAKALVGEVESLADTGGYVSSTHGGRLHAAEVVSWVWAPDAVGDTPRYVVDVLFSVTTL